MSIGARSQSARTYLEKHLKEFNDSSLDELITHGLNALLDSQPNEVVLNKNVITLVYFLKFLIFIVSVFFSQNTSISYVCKGENFRILSEADTEKCLEPLQARYTARNADRKDDDSVAGGVGGSKPAPKDDAPEDPEDPQVAVAMEVQD